MPKIFLFIFSFFLFSNQYTLGQVRIDTTYSVNDIVNKILIDNTVDLHIKNIKYTGSKSAIGVFMCDMKYNSFIKKGIIISTGDVMDALGPNTSTNKSSKTYINNDPELEELINNKTFDAATLEFDFISTGDSISFNFFFASEEYPEYVNKHVNDVFAFLITDLKTGKKNNIALLPSTNIPITVDNINAKENNNYFIENPLWNSRSTKEWTDQKQVAELAYAFEFDGLTKLIYISTPTKKGNAYHLKMSIADVGDRLFNSAIIIEANSFKTHISKQSTPLSNVQKAFSISNADADSVSVSLNIRFASSSSKIKDNESFKLLNKVYQALKENPNLRVQVNGHTDETGTFDHNIQLSEERAMTVSIYLQDKGIASERITYKGFGSTRPASNTDKSLNRRVDFIFKVQ